MLDRSDFDLFVGTDEPERIRPQSRRVKVVRVVSPVSGPQRAAPFLTKFRSLLACAEHTESEWLIQMDADAIFADDLTAGDVRAALEGSVLGMTEQSTICGSGMTRRDFLDHYTRYSLAWLAPRASAPPLETYRFFNSGVVLGRRDEMRRIAAWADRTAGGALSQHRQGDHMIADQDYFQVWTNTLHPGSCRTLPWCWNHCEQWDPGFPRIGARILHFSNHCLGPRIAHIMRMAYFRHFYGSRSARTRESAGPAGLP